MMMNIYDPMEIIITPDITYILMSHVQRIVSANLHR